MFFFVNITNLLIFSSWAQGSFNFVLSSLLLVFQSKNKCAKQPVHTGRILYLLFSQVMKLAVYKTPLFFLGFNFLAKTTTPT